MRRWTAPRSSLSRPTTSTSTRPRRLTRLLAAVLSTSVAATGMTVALGGSVAAAATEQDGMTLSLDDGQTLSGVVDVTAQDTRTTGAASISIDGAEQSGAVVTPAPGVTIRFAADGWAADATTTWVINGTHEIQPMQEYSDWGIGEFEIPLSALRPGENTAELRVGSTTQVLDPAAGANDDFVIRNVRMRFPDGAGVSDPRYASSDQIAMGDADGSQTTHTWTYRLPAQRVVSTTTLSLDAGSLAPGEHVVTATSSDGARSASATVVVPEAPAAPERVILTPPQDPSTSQSFTWRTPASVTEGSVFVREAGSEGEWAETPGYANDPITAGALTTRTHSATVTGLEPATEYEYHVGVEGNLSGTHRFTTAGAPGDPFTFISFGDAQNDLTDKWAPVVDAAYARYPDAVGTVNAGDLINDGRNGDDAEWTEWFDAMDGYRQTTNVIAAPGNHEYIGDSFLKKWKSAFEYDRNGPQHVAGEPSTPAEQQEEAYRERIAEALQETAYYTDYQGVRFIALNAGRNEASDLYTPEDLPACSEGCPDPKQLWLDMQAEWLDEILAANPGRWAVATFHQPVFSTAVGRDEVDVRETWLPVFQSNDIDLVLMGHDHTYARGFVNSDATSTPGMTRGPVYAVSVSGPKYYEQQPADDNVWTRNGATQVVRAGHTSTFQGITVDGDTLHYEAVVAAKWDDASTTDVPVGEVLDSFTITKYDSGAKRVTEEGVTPPVEDPGPDTEEPGDDGLQLNLPNGATVSGIQDLRVTDSLAQQTPTISIDGELQDAQPAAAGAELLFQAYGWDAGTLNTFIFNGTHEIVPLTRYYDDDAVVSWKIPEGALRPGPNTIELKTASRTMINDPRDNANDDFRIRNVRMRFADGTTVGDPRYSASEFIYMGDSTGLDGRHLNHTWTVDVADGSVASGAAFTWDTTTTDTGLHEVTARSADGTRSRTITVAVDNYEPVTLDVEDDDVLRGTRALTVTTDVEPSVAVDGTPVPVELRRRVLDPTFVFEAHGFQPAAAANSVWVNGELYRVLRVGYGAQNYSTVRVTIPWEKLQPGRNVIRLRSGSSIDPEGDKVDVFSTRNTRLEFAGERVVRDPQYAPSQILNFNNNARFRDFTFTIPDRYETVYQADWDTSTGADGQHTVTVTRPDGRSAAAASVVVDNSGPRISVASPVDGGDYATESFVVDASAEDAHDVASLELSIDGEAVEHGQTVTADDLTDGEHTFVARAVDTLGNESERSVTFRSVGNLPKVPTVERPVDGGTGIEPAGTDLAVRVVDPTGDAMDVDFRWAYRGDFARGGSTVRVGGSTTKVPERDAGTVVADHSALAVDDGEVLTTEGDAEYPFQQFEIAVPDDLEAQSYEVEWTGSVPTTQRAALSVWNHRTGAWELVADGTGADLELRGEASYVDTVRDGVARVLVQDVPETVIAEGDDPAVWAWVSDTQFYSQNDPEVYEKQMQWVLDHRESDRIGYAIHTGDIVNTRDPVEWERADAAQKMWDDAGMPYGIVPGNHDIEQDGSYTMYQRYFGEDRFAGKPWYGGGHDDNVQHYDVVSTPAADYVVIYVDWVLDQADIEWANEVIEEHRDHNVIVATHQYTDESGEFINPGHLIWEQIIEPNENVDAVLYGHIGIWTGTRDADTGRTVVEVMADYQSAPNNGDGWMRTITLDAANQTFSNASFSVTHDRTSWKDDAKENFTMPMTLEAPERSVSTDFVGVTVKTDTAIETVQDVESGTVATAGTGELLPETRYSWYVEATDAAGFSTESPVWHFSTGERTASATTTTLEVAGELVEGADLTLTATVAPADAAGSVEFRDGEDVIGSAEVAGGVAHLTTAALAAGDHSLTAVFTPTDGTAFTGSVSTPVPVTVQARAGLDLPVEVAPRCLAGNAFLAVRAVNGEDVPVDVTLSTPYGSRELADVAPGRSAYQTFAVRSGSVPAGHVTVSGTAVVGGEQVVASQDVAFDAVSCS